MAGRTQMRIACCPASHVTVLGIRRSTIGDLMSFDERLWRINEALTPVDMTAFGPLEDHVPLTLREKVALYRGKPRHEPYTGYISPTERRRAAKALAYLSRNAARVSRQRIKRSKRSLRLPKHSPLHLMARLDHCYPGGKAQGRQMDCFPLYGIARSIDQRQGDTG